MGFVFKTPPTGGNRTITRLGVYIKFPIAGTYAIYVTLYRVDAFNRPAGPPVANRVEEVSFAFDDEFFMYRN